MSGAPTSDEALASADLLLVTTGWACVDTGLIVEETPDAVTVALVVADTAGGVRPNCATTMTQTGWFAVDLAEPLGDRDVLTVDGPALREG